MRKLKVFEFVSNLEPLTDSKVSILRTPSPVDSFVTESVEMANGKTRIHIVNDIGILFNQQRLAQMSPMMIESWLGMVRNASPDDGLTDEQILSVIKSRYIQSNADVYNWTRWLQQNMDGLIAEAKERAAQHVQEAEENGTQQSTPVAAE